LSAVAASSAAVAIVAVLFGLKFSVEFLINRGTSYLILPTILAFITEMRYQTRRQRLYLYPLIVLAIPLSALSFNVQAATDTVSTYVTRPEEPGYEWLLPRLTAKDVVFTDYRLSGPFIADGFFRVVGITGQGSEPTAALLKQIYYSNSPRSITAGIDQLVTYHDGREPTYLFLSTLMTKTYPGINGYGNHYLPPSQDFFKALNRSPDWTMVYRNSVIRIYKRKSPAALLNHSHARL
jgi:hypothetical protein